MTALATQTETIAGALLANLADRVAHWARSCGRPAAVSDDLVVSYQGDHGVFTNSAVVLEPPDGPDAWAAVAARVAEVVPGPAPVMLYSPGPTPDLAPL